MGLFIRGRIRSEKANPVNRLLHAVHAPTLRLTLKWPKMTILLALIALAATAYPLSRLGSEFMPPLDEGDLLYMPTMFPGLSITKAKEILQQTDKILKTFPEVRSVFGKVGRAETATDPAPLSMIETTVRLKPREDWPDPKKSTRQLMNEMDAAIRFPGVTNTWTLPIKNRIDMLSTGIKTPVGIKISGPDLKTLENIGKKIEAVMKGLPETLSAFADRAASGYYMDIDINRDEIARYGLTIGDVEDVIQTAVGGMNVTQTVEGLERYPVNLRYPRDLRDDPRALGRVLVPTPVGPQVPLAQLADIRLARGAPVIKSENARPNAWIYVDLKSSDIGGFVKKAKEAVARQVEIPAGYSLIWSGQFEYMERAAARLRVVIPFTLVGILLLLYLNFRTLSAPLLVMLSVPFAVIGGVWTVYWLGFNMSVAVAVGFIALAGVSAEIGVLVLTFIDQEVARIGAGGEDGSAGPPTSTAIAAAVQRGTAERVRPIVMTATAIIGGLVPIMFGGGTGSEIMQRIAAPMIGGMVTATLLGLVVLPVIYGLVLQVKMRRNPEAQSERATDHTGR